MCFQQHGPLRFPVRFAVFPVRFSDRSFVFNNFSGSFFKKQDFYVSETSKLPAVIYFQ